MLICNAILVVGPLFVLILFILEFASIFSMVYNFPSGGKMKQWLGCLNFQYLNHSMQIGYLYYCMYYSVDGID